MEKKKNLSDYDAAAVPSGAGATVGVVVSEWNAGVTEALARGAVDTLRRFGVEEKDILVRHVPGSFELTMGAQWMAEYSGVDAVICIGCVVQGETPHFNYICESVTHGITELNMKYNIPFIFGLLTVNTLEQALDRAGGKHGNKGEEAAVTALKMIALKRDLL
jgi:6,7-dimethyl-8-ribityllumazine synthase